MIIDISEFGGVLPSVKARDLTDPFAQVAVDVDQRFPDFRPTKTVGSSLTTVASAAKSVFRTPINGTWLSSASDVDFVASQTQDLTTERVFLTGRVGYPEVWDHATSAYRQLGVPRPTAAPTFEVQEVYQFTQSDAIDFRAKVVRDYSDAIVDNLSRGYAGYVNTAPAGLTDGAMWLPHGTTTSPSLPTTDSRMGAYCVPITTSGASYKVVSEKHLFVVNPALNGKVITYSGQTYLATPMYANGATYVFGSSGFQADVAAIMNPEGTAQFLPGPKIAELAATHVLAFNPAESPAAEYISDMEQYVNQAILYLNPPSGEMLKQAIVDFYTALLSSGGAVDKAADNLANTLYEMASAVWSTAADSPFLSSPIPSDVIAFVEPS
jgi:hypothetical protein